MNPHQCTTGLTISTTSVYLVDFEFKEIICFKDWHMPPVFTDLDFPTPTPSPTPPFNEVLHSQLSMVFDLRY